MKLHDILESAAKRWGDNIFLFEGDKAITYNDATQVINHIAGGLLSRGIQKGDRIAIFSSDSINYILTVYGIFKAGAIAATINIRNADSLSYYVNDMKANALFFSLDVAPTIQHNRENMSTVQHYMCIDGDFEDTLGWNTLVSSTPIKKNIEINDRDPCHLSYTSGTSGNPKGCVLAHGPTARSTNCIAERLLYKPTDTILSPTTMSSSYRLVASDLPGFHRGSSIGIMKTWNPYLALDIITQKSVTVLVGNPIILKDLIDAAKNDGRICSSLRMVVSGGGPVYRSLKEDYQRYFKIPLVESCGQSELGGFFALGYPKMIFDEKISAVGPPLPDKEVQIVDEKGNEVPIGTPGEIALRGGYMWGYWERPEETAHKLRNNWLHSGDAAKMDKDQYIYVLGRMSERIKSENVDIYPRMLEESMSQHQAIRQVAVVRVTDRKSKEIPKAYVSLYPASKISETKLMRHFRRTLGEYAPREIEIVDQMPMTPTGKISKRELREREQISGSE